MKERPAITVIIPTFNRATTLGRAIDSVLCQTFDDFELIIVDDGSRDGTLTLVQAYRDKRIRVIAHSENLGQSAACNTGIENSRGDTVCFLDSDDIWLCNYLEKVVRAFECNPHVGFVYARLLNGPEWSIEGQNKYAEVLAQGFLSCTITLSARKSALDRVGRFNPAYSVCNDDDLCFRLAREFSFVLIPEGLAVAVRTNSSMSRVRHQTALGWEKLFLDYRQDIITHCGGRVLAFHSIKLSNCFFACFDLRKGLRYLLVGMTCVVKKPAAINPFSKKNILQIPFVTIKYFVAGLKWRIRNS
jgi:glycosyltransferase involved in cell wall biosynthesis